MANVGTGFGRLQPASTRTYQPEQSATNNEIAHRLPASMEFCDEAVLTADPGGTIASWNSAAEQLFGYAPTDIVGMPVTILLPADRQDQAMSQLRRGEHIRDCRMASRRKDGTRTEISLSVTPLYDANGRMIGAGIIARAISERERSDNHLRLLLREMDHRLKNLFALAASLVSISARDAGSADELASIVQERLVALARAHSLIIPVDSGLASHGPVGLHPLLETLVEPYKNGDDGYPRVWIDGDDLQLSSEATTAIALIVHELATNAAKYGALSSSAGRITVECMASEDMLTLIWQERGGPPHECPKSEGFGSLLGRMASRQLGGGIVREWRPEGLRVTVTARRDRMMARSHPEPDFMH